MDTNIEKFKDFLMKDAESDEEELVALLEGTVAFAEMSGLILRLNQEEMIRPRALISAVVHILAPMIGDALPDELEEILDLLRETAIIYQIGKEKKR